MSASPKIDCAPGNQNSAGPFSVLILSRAMSFVLYRRIVHVLLVQSGFAAATAGFQRLSLLFDRSLCMLSSVIRPARVSRRHQRETLVVNTPNFGNL